jgi:hypothetical protein
VRLYPRELLATELRTPAAQSGNQRQRHLLVQNDICDRLLGFLGQLNCGEKQADREKHTPDTESDRRRQRRRATDHRRPDEHDRQEKHATELGFGIEAVDLGEQGGMVGRSGGESGFAATPAV